MFLYQLHVYVLHDFTDGPSLPSGGNTKKLDVDLHGHHEDNSRTPDTKKDISSSTNGTLDLDELRYYLKLGI